MIRHYVWQSWLYRIAPIYARRGELKLVRRAVDRCGESLTPNAGQFTRERFKMTARPRLNSECWGASSVRMYTHYRRGATLFGSSLDHQTARKFVFDKWRGRITYSPCSHSVRCGYSRNPYQEGGGWWVERNDCKLLGTRACICRCVPCTCNLSTSYASRLGCVRSLSLLSVLATCPTVDGLRILLSSLSPRSSPPISLSNDITGCFQMRQHSCSR